MLTSAQVKLLKRLSPRGPTSEGGEAYVGKSKLLTCMGRDFAERLSGKTVIDFGCGTGDISVELAQLGARRVIGVDIVETHLLAACEKARQNGVGDICCFATSTQEKADIILSIDAFEHYGDPGAVIAEMADMLSPGGTIEISFGPTWYHPLGGHLFSVFPWAHLLFSEEALIRWRSDFKTDGATRFREVAGGLNQMTIRGFRRIISESRLRLESFTMVPIRKLRWLHSPITREFTTSVVRCSLRHDGRLNGSRPHNGRS